MKAKAFRLVWQGLPFAPIIFGIFVALGGIFCAIFGQTGIFEGNLLQLIGLGYGLVSGMAAGIMAFQAVSRRIECAEFMAHSFFLNMAWVGASFGIFLHSVEDFWLFTGAGLLGIAIGVCFFPLRLLWAYLGIIPGIILRNLH